MATVKKKVFALGFFDCIHLGHRYLLQKARQFSMLAEAELQVLTFDDNFLSALSRNEKEVFTLDERRRILRGLGAKEVTVLNEEVSFFDLTAEDFLKYIAEKSPYAVFAGSDYRYGKNASGNMDMMSQYFANSKTKVYNVDLKTDSGEKISSKNIRALIEKGSIEEANKFLGGKYFITGQVIKGRGIGGELGIPTANIFPKNIKLLPPSGVYQTETVVSGKLYKSITSIGDHPTFDDENYNVETLLLNFNGNLYGKVIKVSFMKRLRNIVKFNSAEELVRQIKNDIEQIM